MDLYFIEYELRNERNYPKITKELESYGAVRVLNSYWCFKRSNTSTKDLRDHFQKFIDSDDALMVTKVTGWASSGTLSNPKKI